MRLQQWAYKLPLRVRSLFRRNQVEQELEAEFEFHLERQIEEHIKKGLSPQEARHTAMRALQGIEQRKEECRDTRGVSAIENIIRDLRYAFRMIRRNPGFTAVTVISLALGIGANTAIFSAMDALILRRLPVPEPSRLVQLKWTTREYPQEYLRSIEGGVRFAGGGKNETFSYSTFRELRKSSLASVFAVSGNGLRVNLGLRGGAETGGLQGVSGNYFESLGVSPILGRAIGGEDDTESAAPVVVLSYTFWQQKLGQDPSILGRTLDIDGHPWTVVGVAPPGFFGLERSLAPDLWVPLGLYARHDAEAAGPIGSRSQSTGTLTVPDRAPSGIRLLNDPKVWWLRVIGRLNPAVTETQARSEWMLLLSRSLPTTTDGAVPDSRTPRLDTLQIERGLGGQVNSFTTPLLLLLSLSGLVLLIACANVAGLLLARSTARQREIAIRISLGVGRSRLIRQLMTEHLLLATIGGAAGLLLGAWAHSALVTLLLNRVAPDMGQHLDVRVLGFTAAISLLSGVLFGLAPAIRAARGISGRRNNSEVRIVPPSRNSSRHTGLSGKMLVAGQVAISMVLLIVAGLFLRTLQELYRVDLGFERQHLVQFTVQPGLNGYTGPKLVAYYEELQSRLNQIPGVKGASFASRAPIGGGAGSSAGTIVGVTDPSTIIQFFRHEVAAAYFETLGIPLVHGRAIKTQDGASAPKVVVINQKTADSYFKNMDPIGHRIYFGSTDWEYEVVGVVKDAKYNNLRDDTPMTVYIPYGQYFSPLPAMTFVVRADGDFSTLANAIRHEAQALDRAVPIFALRTESEAIDRTLSLERTFATLSAVFGLVALAVACVGLYGTMAYALARRTYEIGIRLALGAAPHGVLAMILKESIVMIGAGVAIGLPAAWAVTRMLSSRLFGVTASDPITIVAATLIMLVVAGLAGLVPALRASRVDPMLALRSE